MTALLKHVWGVSPAADRVWTQVACMRPEQAKSNDLVEKSGLCLL